MFKSQIPVIFLMYLVASMLLVRDVWSAPAAPMTFELRQPDGYRFLAVTRGDEFATWTETTDGHTVMQLNDRWYYAEPDGTAGIRASAIAVGELSPAELNIWPRSLSPRPDPGAFELRNSYRLESVAPGLEFQQGPAQQQRVLTVLVDYTDITFTYTDASFQSLIYGGTNSVNEFFQENSYNNLDIVPATEIYGTANDGIVHVSRPVNHPNSGQSFPSNNAEAKAIMPLVDGFVDFSTFDDNGDGDVTPNELSIVFILAGYERSFGGEANAKSPSVWGHQSSFASFFPPFGLYTLDGKNLAPYTMFGERHGTVAPDSEHQSTIGIICHELAHLMFGLPDLYDSDGGSSGIGRWGLMGGGSWNFTGAESGDSPAHLNAWSKQTTGLTTPVNVTGVMAGAAFPDAENSSTSRRLWIDPYGWREYFLVENRQLSGYDSGLPGAGLLIWHVDEFQTSNRDAAHKWVDLEEADGLAELDNSTSSGDGGDPFPGSSSNTTFDDSSNPDSREYSGAATNISVSNVSASSADMTADVQPRTGAIGDHVSYSDRLPRQATGFGTTTGYAGVRVQNTTAQDKFHGVDVYIVDSVGATVDIQYFTSMAGGIPSGLIHSETGFNATAGWNRLLLAAPQDFPPAAERGIVLKIGNNSSSSVFSRDNSRSGSGRSYIDGDGLGTYSVICVGPGETCGDLNIVTLLGSTADLDPPGISISSPSTGNTISGPVTYTITYSEAENVTLADEDVTLNITGTATGTVGVSGSGNSSRLVTISAISGVGSLGISIAAGTASDAANNQAGAAGPSETFAVGQPELIFSDSFE